MFEEYSQIAAGSITDFGLIDFALEGRFREHLWIGNNVKRLGLWFQPKISVISWRAVFRQLCSTQDSTNTEFQIHEILMGREKRVTSHGRPEHKSRLLQKKHGHDGGHLAPLRRTEACATEPAKSTAENRKANEYIDRSEGLPSEPKQ